MASSGEPEHEIPIPMLARGQLGVVAADGEKRLAPHDRKRETAAAENRGQLGGIRGVGEIAAIGVADSTTDEIDRSVSIQDLGRPGKAIQLEGLIGAQREEVRSARHPQPPLAGGRVTDPLRADDGNPCRAISLQDLKSQRVRRAVVHDQDVVVSGNLEADGLERVGEVLPLVPTGQNGRNPRRAGLLFASQERDSRMRRRVSSRSAARRPSSGCPVGIGERRPSSISMVRASITSSTPPRWRSYVFECLSTM